MVVRWYYINGSNGIGGGDMYVDGDDEDEDEDLHHLVGWVWE